MKIKSVVVLSGLVLTALALPFSTQSFTGNTIPQGPVVSLNPNDCGCSLDRGEQPQSLRQIIGSRSLDPEPPTPQCDPNCPTLSMPDQTRCVGQWAWEDCDDRGYEYKSQTRKRWKWICPSQNYISCGTWYDNGNCCTAYDPGPSCAGNSLLTVCEGTPPGTE